MTSEGAKTLALALHNTYREKHGSPPLQWSEELAQAGTEGAAALILNPDAPLALKPGVRWGQNIFEYEAEGYGQISDDDVIEDAIHTWFEDVANYDTTNPAASKGGNFSQLIWASTLRVGLGLARKEEAGSTSIVVLAFYDPPGNFKDQFSSNVSSQNAVSLRTKTDSNSSSSQTQSTSTKTESSNISTMNQGVTSGVSSTNQNSSLSQMTNSENRIESSSLTDKQNDNRQVESQDQVRLTSTTQGSTVNRGVGTTDVSSNVNTQQQTKTTVDSTAQTENLTSMTQHGQTEQDNLSTNKTTTITTTVQKTSDQQESNNKNLAADSKSHDTSTNQNDPNYDGSKKFTKTTTTTTTTIKGTTMEGADNPDYSKNVTTVTKTSKTSDGVTTESESENVNIGTRSEVINTTHRDQTSSELPMRTSSTVPTEASSQNNQSDETSRKVTTITTSVKNVQNSGPDLTSIIQNIAETAEKKGLVVTMDTQDVQQPNSAVKQVTTITATSKGGNIQDQNVETIMEDLVSKIPNLDSTRKTTTTTINTTVTGGSTSNDGQDLTEVMLAPPSSTSTSENECRETRVLKTMTTSTNKTSNVTDQDSLADGPETDSLNQGTKSSQRVTTTTTTTIQKGSPAVEKSDQTSTKTKTTTTTTKTITTTDSSGGVECVEISPEAESQSHTKSFKSIATVDSQNQSRGHEGQLGSTETKSTVKSTTKTTTTTILSRETLESTVKVHNEFRIKHGASAVQIDDVLCQEAQKCAKSIVTKTVYKSENLNVGQNVYRISGPPVDPKEAIRTAVNVWYSKIVDYNFNDPMSSSQSSKLFSQLVWKSCKTIGVGVETEGNTTAVVVYYSPPGNVATDERYRENVQPPNC